MASQFDSRHYAERLAQLARIILAPDRAFFWQAAVFSVAISVLTLAVPLSVQILIGSVANIALLRPIVVLAVVLFTLLAMYGLLVGVQAHLMDVFERRLFARVTQEIVMRSIQARYAVVESINREELANRFFEIITIQRNMPALVINGSTIVLQTVVGFAVVSAYHPVFLIFNIGVLLLLYLVWKLWAGAAIRSKLASSYAKYQVAHWLEELARANAFFKSSRTIHFALSESERVISNYVTHHRRHFRYKFTQQIGFLALYAGASATLLGVGGWLVISNELTLGQLVAAELILASVFASMARISSLLEEFYELCAALYKLGDFFDLPLEPSSSEGESLAAGPADLRFTGVQTHLRDRLFEFDFEIPAGAKIMAVVDSHALQKCVTDLAMRHVEPERGAIVFGGHDFADLNIQALRDDIVVVENSGVLERSIEENLTLGDPGITRAAMRDLLAAVGLEEVINGLPDGLTTQLGAFGYPLSRSETIRLKIAAAVLARPKVLILTQIFDTLSAHHRRQILDYLTHDAALSLLNFTDRRDFDGYGAYWLLKADGHHVFDRIEDLIAFERTRENVPPA